MTGITGNAGITGITDNLKNGKSLTDLRTTSNQEMLAHLKTKSVELYKGQLVIRAKGVPGTTW